ncbi:T9SS type B sorting domain-containing protein [Cryomorpha ignava]|uniref:T9SS type B sorting domain-containing protein n=2 Tax=Cryomorpha ignava TaxID=101383 RepID=A0A7K3WM47_9FLAO|nr:T9SS type B sorting domain-containing protein [Cryomorpha ignava]
MNTDLSYDFEFSGESNNITEVLWTFADGSTSNSQSPTKSYNSNGLFPFSLEIIMDSGCVYESEGNTIISEAPEPPDLPDSISICEGESQFLDFSGFSGWDQILDQNGDLVTSYSFDEPGVFNFTFIDGCGQIEYSVEIIQTNPGELITGTTEYSTCSSTTVIPDLSETISGNTYQWTPATGLSNPNILNPTITVSEPTDYMLVATGDCGFTDTLLVSIGINTTEVLEIEGQSELTVCPNQMFNPELDANLSENTYLWVPTAGLSDPTALNPEITITEPTIYTLTASNPCAPNITFELAVAITDPLDFELVSELTICNGDTIEIPGQLNSEADVEWANSNTLSALDIPNPLAFPNSNTTYQVSVSDQCETISETIEVIVNQAPHISGISNLDICVGDTAYANINNTGNHEVTSWNWTPTAGLENATKANSGIFNENNITYQVEATNSCGSDLFEVQLTTYILDAVLDLDSIVCPGAPLLLSAQGAETYSWFPMDIMNNPNDSVTTAQIYTNQLIQLQLSGGTCVKIFSDYVEVYEDIGFTQLDPVHLFAGEYYDLSPIESQYKIVLSGSTFLSFDADTTISLSYVDYNGCEFHLFLPIIIAPALYIPNGFTPDGDGINDIFKPIAVNIENFEMRIYNRLGELVFQSNSLNNGWNGGMDGYYCPDDIYNYVIEYSYHTTEVKVQRGFVTLVR